MATISPVLCAPIFNKLLSIDLPSYIFSVSACSIATMALVAACVYPRKPIQHAIEDQSPTNIQ